MLKLDRLHEVPPTLFVRSCDDGLGASVKLFVVRYWFQPADAPEPCDYIFVDYPLGGFTYGPNWETGCDEAAVTPRGEAPGVRHRFVALGNPFPAAPSLLPFLHSPLFAPNNYTPLAAILRARMLVSRARRDRTWLQQQLRRVTRLARVVAPILPLPAPLVRMRRP